MNIVVTAAPPACGARQKVSTVLSSGHNEKTGKAGHDLTDDTMKKLLLAALAVTLPSFGVAGDKAAKVWDVAAPPLPTREVGIDVAEGTWMNIDLSPDGNTIAFDLLGDIYVLPIAGGTATRIAAGLPMEMQPRFSPDGSRIAFTSDRGGGDNIWVMQPDGSDKRQLTHEDFRLLNSPAWSPDGRFIAARKHFTTERSLGAGEIWLYHLGGGSGVPVVKRGNEKLQKELGEPAFAADGGSVFYSRNTTPGPIFEYAQDSNAEVFAIERIDLATGEVFAVAGGAGGAVRATPSPDGRKLAFVTRERGISALYVMDLASGQRTRLYAPLDQDMQEGWAVQSVYPGMDWTPDSQNLVFWAGGKIHRASLDGRQNEIAFRVNDTRVVIDPPRPRVAVAPERFTARMARHAGVSPEGKRVVWESAGTLWTRRVTDGEPQRLTSSRTEELELFPSFSRDGKRIVFVAWTDRGLGEVRSVSATGGGTKTLTREPGHYRRPRFSPDGSVVVFEKGIGGDLLSGDWSQTHGVFRVPAEGGAMSRISAEGSYPHFGARNDRVYMTLATDGSRTLVSTDLNGEAQLTHATGEMVAEYQVSPRGDHVAYIDNYAAWVMPLLPGPQAIAAGSGAKDVPVTRASAGGATFPTWSADGSRLSWTLGPTLYSAALADMIALTPAAEAPGTRNASAFTPPTEGVSLAVQLDTAKPRGHVAITGARIVTMSGADGGIIEDGTIVLEGPRIVAIGPRAGIDVPADARVIDASGKTVMPGFIDAHAHGPFGDDDIVPQQNWSQIAHLALGVTTIHNPSTVASEAFTATELQRAGRLLGPRSFSTGEIIYGARSPGLYAEINSYEDALAHVRRLKAQGAHSIKNYNQPRRDQRQQVVAAAIAEDMEVVAEGGSLFAQDVSIIQDGNTSLEHNFPQRVLYEDVLSLFSQSKVAYTPTLVVSFGGLGGDEYWRSATNVWEHPILSRHVPPHILQPKSVRRVKAPDVDFQDQYIAREAHKLAARGVMVNTGAHGQEEGLGTHWELWSLVRGGWTPLEALRAATATPARHLGLDADIGTLETGKLADLLILDANPLDDIRNSDTLSGVMLNGRLYDPATMNEKITGDSKRAPYYWEK